MCLFEFLLFTFESISSLDINFFCHPLQIGVLALAALAFAEPEADPAYLYRGYYGGFRPYWGYGYGLPW